MSVVHVCVQTNPLVNRDRNTIHLIVTKQPLYRKLPAHNKVSEPTDSETFKDSF